METVIKDVFLRLNGTNIKYPHVRKIDYLVQEFKSIITAFLLVLQEEYQIPETSNSESNIDKKQKRKKNKSDLHKELDEVIAKAMSANYTEKVKTDKATLTKVIKKELSLFQNVGTRGFYLSKVYNYLFLIKPTSVESERAFSSGGYFCNKIRSKMNDDTLRTYFQTQ